MQRQDLSTATSHYDEAYFRTQVDHAELKARLECFKFAPFVREGDSILDFGCGPGALLSVLGGTAGVEVNPAAVAYAETRGLTVMPSLGEWPDSGFDVVLSHHALEHCENPLAELRQMARVCKPGGTLVLVVPCDRARYPFMQFDRDFHLFSWSANNLGNLVKLAGFDVVRAEEIRHRFPPKFPWFARIVGERALNRVCWLYGWVPSNRKQVRVVAKRG